MANGSAVERRGTQSEVARTIRIARLILGLMGAALIGMTVTMILIGPPDALSIFGDPAHQIVLLILIPLASSDVVGYFLVRHQMLTQARKELGDDARDRDARIRNAAKHYLKLTIVAAALVEGVGLFGAIALLITKGLIAILAPALSIMMLAVLWPTLAKLDSFERAVAETRI